MALMSNPPVLVAGSSVDESHQKLPFLLIHHFPRAGLTAWHMTSPCEGAVSWETYGPAPICTPPSS